MFYLISSLSIFNLSLFGNIILLIAFPKEIQALSKVTCGSVLKLQSQPLHYLLHSHDIKYGSGSQQQSVTGFNGGDDANSYWMVKGQIGSVCPQGTAIKKGSTVRLQHVKTKKWLHSHWFNSPLTAKQEISCFGGGTGQDSDSGDQWQVNWDSQETEWQKDQQVYFKHQDTSIYLEGTNSQYPRPIQGQYEVGGNKKRTKYSRWIATEGIYFPVENTQPSNTTEKQNDEL